MHKWIDNITQHCIRIKIVKEADAQWFQYGIAKRFSTFLVGLPFLFLTIALTDIPTTISFFISFFLLRTKTNGYHAKTMCGCIATSLLAVVLLCASVNSILTSYYLFIPSAVSYIVIYKLAPYTHPNLPLPSDAITECRKQARLRATMILAVTILTLIFGVTVISKGLTMGITMTSSMLCFPYIKRKVTLTWRKSMKKSKKWLPKWRLP